MELTSQNVSVNVNRNQIMIWVHAVLSVTLLLNRPPLLYLSHGQTLQRLLSISFSKLKPNLVHLRLFKLKDHPQHIISLITRLVYLQDQQSSSLQSKQNRFAYKCVWIILFRVFKPLLEWISIQQLPFSLLISLVYILCHQLNGSSMKKAVQDLLCWSFMTPCLGS